MKGREGRKDCSRDLMVQEDCKYLLDEGMWDGEEVRACERTRTRERDSTPPF